MNEAPILSNGQLITAILGIGSTLGSVITFLFYQYKTSRDKADADKDTAHAKHVGTLESENAWLRSQVADFRQTISAEAKEDRTVLQALRESLQPLTQPSPRTRR